MDSCFAAPFHFSVLHDKDDFAGLLPQRPPHDPRLLDSSCFLACWQVSFDDHNSLRKNPNSAPKSKLFISLTFNEQILDCFIAKEPVPAIFQVSLGKGPASDRLDPIAATLGQGVPIKDGVSIPGKNVGAVKQGSAVTFGSIDDASAPISSSPAAPAAPIKSEIVKSFGTVPAQPQAATQHVNGKPSISKSIGMPSPTTSTPASAAPSTSSSPAPKLNKVDVRALFQSPSTPAPPSQPENSSPSVRPTTLPQQQTPQPQNQAGQPSQFGTTYPTFIPRQQQQQQNAGASGSRPPPSPVYGRPPMTNGNGPRPPNGPQGPNSTMGSPRLSQAPQPGLQPGLPPQMGPPMGQMWGGYYYPAPGMPPEQAGYMYQAGGWYAMPPPQMPPQGQPMPPMPQQTMSPRTHPMPIHSGPGTPTPAHAAPVPHHVPPPIAPQHSTTSSVSASVASPPPTPSSARLNTGAAAFVPGGAQRPKASKIVLKSADGKEVNLGDLKAQTSAAAPATPPTATVPLTASPGHQSRKSVQIRMESEEARKKRIAEEEAKEKAEKDKAAKAKADAEEKARKEKEAAERKKKEAEEKKRAEEEAERKRKEDEEKKRLEAEERKRKEEQEAKAKAEAEAKAKAEAEEKARKEKERKEEEEKQRLKAEEEAKVKKEAEEKAAAEAAAAAAAAPATLTEEPETVSEVEEGEVQEVEAPPADKEDAGEATPVKDLPLRIDTTPLGHERRRPGRLDLSGTLKSNVPAPLPSALATARIIDDLSRVPYPENIQSPKIELNVNAKDGKFRYDRDFLLQFMLICKEKPDNLPPLDAIGIGPVDQATMTRTSSRGGHSRPGRTTSISGPSSGNTTPGFPFPSKGSQFGGSIGQFHVGGAKLTSAERFELANGGRSASGSAMSAFGRPAMQRTSSQPGVGSALGSKRTRSKRGETRDKHNSTTQPLTPIPGLENAAPLQVTANRWDRRALNQVDPDSPEIVDRKVKSLLNKLTMEKFDSISDKIIEFANRSENEKDGRTLIQVIRLVFEKATDEATWSEMYARLCRKMMEQISPKVQDDGIKTAEGKPIAGGQLFRKYLLNRCQEDFERGWVAKEATAAAAAIKATEDKAKQAQEKKDEEGGDKATDGNDEPLLYSDEYYAAQKAKRQGLGLIKFIGELFKLQMLTERIMHECVKKLLGNVENPEEEEIESLCKLISTVGSLLDTPKARAHMDVYFSRMKELSKSKSVSSRMQFMLQDVIELRDRKWQVRSNQMAAPTTLAAVHEAAAKEQAKAEKESYQRTISMSRGGSRRGADRGDFQGPGPDGWTNVASSGSGPRPPPKAGDLSNFGKIANSKSGLPMTLGPSSVFSGKRDSKRESLSRTNSVSNMSSQNMFSMLSQSEASPESKAAEPAQRKRLILAPRSKPTDEQEPATASATPAGSDESGSSDDDDAVLEMTVEAADRKIAEDLKEFFAIRNLDEAEAYFTALPPVHHARLVEKLVGTAIEAKEGSSQLVSDLFARAASKELCTPEMFEEGFMPIAEILEDIAIDAPKAPHNLALMMKGVSFDSERTQRVADKTGDAERLLGLLSSSS
ncbi:MI domain-containing protein [Mycena chlorophos]|uniref:MI domain-containing protein n=1 Tax=Mycena chlorophos TaxID=658473 RepID=A0A8H6VXZ3_MYCCL|nr:MI domain-containing protein [Mycena chlorophos]